MALYMFFGNECPHCEAMMPTIDAFNESSEVKIEKLEVWHNEENAKKMEEVDQGKCGGVPFFYNDQSKEWICGGTDEETLKKWAAGESVK